MGAVERWRQLGHERIELPSGFQVQLVLPSEDDLLRRGLFPEELRSVAVLMARDALERAGEKDPGPKAADRLSQEQMQKAVQVPDLLVSIAVRRVRPPGQPLDDDEGWEDAQLSPEDLMSLPPGDAEALRAIVQRETTGACVTAVARYNRGEIDEDEVAAIFTAEAGRSLPDWRSFRGIAGGGQPGQPGRPMGPAPLDHLGAGRTRRPRRARSG